MYTIYMLPATDKIVATANTPYIGQSGFNVVRFVEALITLENGREAGEIYNQEFLGAKHWVAQGTEHAQHTAAATARADVYRSLPDNDPRHDIGYAFGMNQAAKLSRNLKNLPAADITPGIQNYIETLDQITGIFEYLKSFKAIIKKGRKPNVTNKTPEELAAVIANTGICCICQNRQKLATTMTMVHHGYKMSEYNHAGYKIGRCFGVDFLPYEFSCEANKQWLAQFLKPELKRCRKHLADLKASVMPTLDKVCEEFKDGKRVKVTKTFAKGTREYEGIRTGGINHTEWEKGDLRDQITYHTALVANWKLRPLKDGTKFTASVEPNIEPKVVMLPKS